MQNVRENCVDASMVITSFRAIFLKAPERDLGPQGLLELLSKPLAAPEQVPGVLLHIYYSLPLTWVQELSTPDDAALSFRLYDGDRIFVRFAGAARLDASIIDFLRRVNDGRVHYSKFAVAHHAAFVEQARRRAASEAAPAPAIGLRALMQRPVLRCAPRPRPFEEGYFVGAEYGDAQAVLRALRSAQPPAESPALAQFVKSI